MLSFRATFIAAATAAALAALPAFAQDTADIQIEDAYARISPTGSGAIFFTIHNHADQDDRLISAAVGEDIAESAELHTHIEDADGVMRMGKVEGDFIIPAGGSRLLERGGVHVMLMGLKQELKDGDSFPLTLSFEQAPEVEVEVSVDNARLPGQSKDHDSGHSDH